MKIRDSSVLVTGADGFIGSHLTEMLARAGARVRALSLYNSFNNWGWLEESMKAAPGIEIVTGDIRDPHFVAKLVDGMDAVFHLAALIGIPYSYVAPESYVATNVQGTLNVLQAARDGGVKRFLQTSTSEVYGTARFVPISEEHPLQPQSPYSATKVAADALAYSFFASFELPVTIVRPFNTYGPRQSARAIIPTVMTQLLSGAASIRLGNLSPTRDLTYVEDTCQAFLRLAECDAAIGQTVNIGSNFEVSIGELCDLIQEVLGKSARIEQDDKRLRPVNSEVERLWCENAKLRAMTGYQPETQLRKGLQQTAEWIRQPENLRKYKADLYNV